MRMIYSFTRHDSAVALFYSYFPPSFCYSTLAFLQTLDLLQFVVFFPFPLLCRFFCSDWNTTTTTHVRVCVLIHGHFFITFSSNNKNVNTTILLCCVQCALSFRECGRPESHLKLTKALAELCRALVPSDHLGFRT